MIRLAMFSSAEKIKGQGVASAYRELLNLLAQYPLTYQMSVNKWDSADISHYHTVDLHFYLSSFSKKRGIKVGYVHFLPETIDDSLELPSLFRTFFYRYLISFYNRMDQLVVVNPSFISKLTAHGIDSEKIHYIPNFVSGQTFYQMDSLTRKQIKDEHNLNSHAFTVIGAGQIQHRKGVLDFIEVAKRLPDVQFVWVGGFSFGKITSGYKELKDIVDNPPSNVRFTGIVDRDQMNTYFNMADLMFLPSFHELFPMTILEAMSCGCPILLRDLELYEDILFDYYVKENSIDGFVDQVKRLKEDKSYYQTASQSAQRGASHYSEERLTDLWNTFYHSLHGANQVSHI
ncbi:glycosyltransferase family 4 protein [Alkalicoccobacillus murimartini]|uniref:1,2-diacylglycerol-3-alpha-glucose alpha-1,2-galactosyltransferase n=1 Tax=Alkalicoccobacillus murimartini TaxID=171685 RepID=A0ABT9YF16_9BACI|nr:glycosyltransferase family 4 protein [Alkalicoccobacillus murimartini]MDQ0206131.1 1,2-diacylglycerol-3-alpha-glucose alpha-1,2-galactosyltransferase [Alkalicoccobacillus murimartini]